jgi:TadE-like protein
LAVEAVVIVPIAMMIVLLVVQLCLWAHASTLVQEAATVGEQSASALGGSPTTGQIEARRQLSTTAQNLVIDPSVQSQTLAGGVVEIRVSGVTESIIPWIHLPVSATRVGLSQEFRESG